MQYQLIQRNFNNVNLHFIDSKNDGYCYDSFLKQSICFFVLSFFVFAPEDVSFAKGCSNDLKGEHAVGILSADKPVFDF